MPTYCASGSRAFAADPGAGLPGARSDEAGSARRWSGCRREVQKLKAERDILKKAAAYFAKEST